MSGSAEPTTAELHLGDRLAALIDGELEDEARERVLAHLATCAGCKAEADGQRRVKSVFAGTAPPPPSDGLMARLQGLPATGSGFDADFGAISGPPTSGSRPDFSFPLGQGGLPGGPGTGVFGSHRGFRTHRGAEMERAAAARGRRFAFAAAGAFSLAAVALGGALTTGQSNTSGSTTASPSRAPAAGVERSDRRGEQALSNSASAARATPTTHNGPLSASLTLRGSNLGSEPRPVLTSSRDGAAPSDAPRTPLSPRLGAGGLLSPPLMLAAYRAQAAEGSSKNMPRPAGTPFALPSANGSPVGPSPGSGASVDVGAPGPSHAPLTSTMASNPRP